MNLHRLTVTLLIFSFLASSSLPAVNTEPESKHSNKVDDPLVVGLCMVGLLGLSVWFAYASYQNHLKQQDELKERRAREANEATKREVEFKVADSFKNLAPEEKKALQQKWFDESKTYMEYLQKVQDHTGISYAVFGEVDKKAEELMKGSNLSPDTYKPARLITAEKLTMYALQLTELRAQQTENIQVMQKRWKEGVLATILDIFVDDSHTDDLDYVRAELARERKQAQWDLTKSWANKPLIISKWKLALAKDKVAGRFSSSNP
jgi:hypothetical protein